MKTSDTPVKLIVGLGNPGPQYDGTRHNAGQNLVTRLVHNHAASLSPNSRFYGLESRLTISSRDVRILIPTTFMNRSGRAVAALCNFYKIPIESVLVVHDELDLAPGAVRLKVGGGHGGHNGLRDIISAMGNHNGFGRLRLGIGHPGNAKQVADYVLKRAPQGEQALIDQAIETALPFITDLVAGNWEKAMRELHSLSTPTSEKH